MGTHSSPPIVHRRALSVATAFSRMADAALTGEFSSPPAAAASSSKARRMRGLRGARDLCDGGAHGFRVRAHAARRGLDGVAELGAARVVRVRLVLGHARLRVWGAGGG